MTRLAKHISENWHAWGVITAAVGFGWTAGWMRLRAEVEAHGDAIIDVRSEVSDVRRTLRADSLKLARIDCILTAQVTKRDPIEECGL